MMMAFFASNVYLSVVVGDGWMEAEGRADMGG